MTRNQPVILAHGGAGTRRLTLPQKRCLADALAAGWEVLGKGEPAMAAVETTIRALERSGLFNAGLGSRRQLDGVQRMDASIMEGRTLRAGAVAGLEGRLHPITAARLIMERTEHVLLAGRPAAHFARRYGVEPLPRGTGGPRSGATMPAAESVTGRRTLALFRDLRRREKLGRETVGAVALDQTGSLAAGASTGGIDLMLPGRVGDTPLIGCGVYADDEAGAVSMTGLGESIIRIAVAKEIVDRLLGGRLPAAAARLVLGRVVSKVQGAAGALVLTPAGRWTIKHTTPRMAAGYCRNDGRPVVKDRFP